MKKFIKSLVTLFIIITVWSCLYKIGLFGKDTIFVLFIIAFEITVGSE